MKQINKLRERKIYNTYDIAKLGDEIMVAYCTHNSRSCLPSWWAVRHTSKSFVNCAWYEHGCRTFCCSKKTDKVTLMKALQFASKVTYCYEWIKTPFGGYVSKVTADKVGLKYNENKVISCKK